MSEEELKEIWNGGQNSPEVDFGKLPELLDIWQKKLSRKIKIEIVVQASFTILPLVSLYYFPKMIFACVLLLLLGIWYIPELRELYQLDEIWTNDADFKNLILLKIRKMKGFFFRTRFVMYVLTPLIIPAVFYGLGYFDRPFQFSAVVGGAVAFEVLVIVLTEIYFAVLYKPSLTRLQKLLAELDC